MVTKQLFVSLPLLRAIEQIPDIVEVDGVTLRFTGEVTSAPIVRGFSAHRAFAEFAGARACIDLSSAGSSRTDLTLRVEGIRAERIEQLVLALRAAMVATQAPVEAVSGERIDVCRTA